MDKKTALLTLKNIEKIGNVTAKKIMDTIKNDELGLKELYSQIDSFKKIKLVDFSVIETAYKKAIDLLEILKNSDVSLITYLDKDYPKSLLSIRDPPVYLFYAGDIRITSKKCVAIVGTRNPSEKGKKIAYNLSSKLCKDNIIISGLAEGIDTEAHRAAVDNNGKTIAILGSGLDIIFPPQNKQLTREIVETGGLIISEYPFGQTPSKYTFIARDRLQSALSEKVFVIETGREGGTMHTAGKAIEYGKELWVFKSNEENYDLPPGNFILIREGAKIFSEDYVGKSKNTETIN